MSEPKVEPMVLGLTACTQAEYDAPESAKYRKMYTLDTGMVVDLLRPDACDGDSCIECDPFGCAFPAE